MEADQNLAVAGASVEDVLENPDSTGGQAESKKGGGRFSRKKDKKKAKPKKTPKQKKGSEESARPVNNSVAGVNDSDHVSPGRPNLDDTPAREDALAVNGDEPVRRDSGIEDGASRLAENQAQGDSSQTLRDSQQAGVQEEEESGVVEGQREKSRSRSGSRKRFSFFRRRGRSGGRNRSKSETDVSKVGRKETSRRHDSAEDVKARNSNSLDRDRGRHSASMDPDRGRHSLSVDRDRGRRSAHSERDNARQTASAERDAFAYRRYDPAKQPRDRLQHMTVKDAVTEYKHRVRNISANAAGRRRATTQRAVSSSVPDVSSAENGQSGEVDQYLLDPEQRTFVKAVATLPRHSRAPSETLPTDSAPAQAPDDTQKGPSHGCAPSSSDAATAPRKNLGEQILEMCRTISGGRGSEREVSEDVSPTSDKSDVADSSQPQNRGGVIPRNVSSVLYINPEDIVVEPDQSLVSSKEPAVVSSETPHGDQGIDVFLDKDARHDQQPRLKPLGQFMELRKSTPAFSCSPVVRERRISHSGESTPKPQGVSPGSSRHSRDPSLDNIPSSGSRDAYHGPSTKSVAPTATQNKPSPEITVNLAQPLDSPSSEMVSSTDSSKTKRSSDQGFYSEPKESDTDSEEETSGFSTPPEEPASGRGAPRHPVTPDVFVNTVKNLLEVPKPRKINRSVSEDNATEASRGQADQSCTRSDSTKSDSHVQSMKAKPSSSNHDTQVEKFEQKTVPVMGTSVQQKYRRTFSPVRGKGIEQSRGDEQVIEILSPQPSAEGYTILKPEEAKEKKFGEKLGQELNQEEDLNRRGRESQRRRGFVSGRSFRKKKEKESGEGQAQTSDKTDGTKPNQQTEEEKAREAAVDDDLSNRLAFYDKSIQTSDSLLNDLLKKTKGKRKLSLFSSGPKKSKVRPDVDKRVTSVLPPPPDYEEERLLGQVPEIGQDVSPAAVPTPDTVHTDAEHVEDTVSPEVTPEVDENTDQIVEQQNVALPSEPSAPKPKSSLRAIVALKQKLARNRKKKAKTKTEEEDKEKEDKKIDEDLPSDTFIHIENEINLSKLAEIKETDILDDEIFEPDFGPALPKKQIRFEPITSDEPIQSEEPLPPLTPASRRLTARRNSTRGRERRRKCLHCCKKFVAFLFSHIGLCSLVAGYTFMGGVVFQALEAPYEMNVKHQITEKRGQLVDKIHSLATGYSLNEVSRDNLTTELEKLLVDYQQYIHTETKDSGWDGKELDPDGDPDQEEYTQWSFASALLYAITVMTTIGYGHVAPKTSYGRVVTIAYAVLGIPLTLLCLTNIGDVMATGFRLLYGKVCCGVCCKLFQPSRRRRRRIPDVEKGLGRQVVTEEGETDKPKEVIQVPTSLCLLLIAGYIFAGALMFSLWEQWDYLTGSYFCFITLSTIGFGDIVPGTNMGDWNQEEKLVLSALYLVFGLSLIAMCFNLVQEDVKAKCRWLGMKIGIIDKPEPPV